MNYRNILTGVAAGLLLFMNTGLGLAAVPQDVPKDVKYILGFYYGNGERILIRENQGRLELLYPAHPQDKCFDLANSYPLEKKHFDSYLLREAGPMSNTETAVHFDRDADGYGINCRVGGHSYRRYPMGQQTGDGGSSFRFPQREDWSELRQQAAAATVPKGLALGVQAQLVELDAQAGLKLSSVYSTEDNCFGQPLYTSTKLFLDRQAAAALVRVQQRLADHGYGILVWDAYRPWSVSLLAHLALPDGDKQLLEDPWHRGSAHNTGLAVDVSLYDLQTGEEVEMLSGFDEPSIRQYTSYPGGTARQRYLRSLLREVMELEGFQGIEMEWWHFIYVTEQVYACLNIPLENIQEK